MATYTGKNISSGYVNIRKTASTSAATNGRVEKGASVQMTDYNNRWYAVSGGYVAGDFFQLNTSGIGSAVTANFTGSVNIRYEPTTAAGTTSVVFKLSTGIAVTKLSTSGTWTKITCANGTGWISSEFLGTGGGTNPGGTGTTAYYDNQRAIRYAKNHTDDTGGGTIAAGTNESFPKGTENQCANFVHQCLVAGGLPMFNGWHHKISGIPTTWNASNGWTWTETGLNKLLGKNRLTPVDYNMVQPGDIIYSYKSSNPAGQRYTHVTIATSNFGYFADKGYGATVCGQTHNHKDRFKELDATNCKCYKINGTITVGADEKQCWLPESGTGGYAL